MADKKRKFEEIDTLSKSEEKELTIAEKLEKHGYVIIPDFIDRCLAIDATSHFLTDLRQHKGGLGDCMAPRSYWAYNCPVFLMMNHFYCEKVSKLVGKDLVPTCAFSRLYMHKDKMKPYSERTACEYTVAITLEYDKQYSSVMIDKYNGDHVTLTPQLCDAIIYKGIELEQYKNEFEGKYYIECLLHYVDKNGEYSFKSYDQHDFNLSIEKNKKRIDRLLDDADKIWKNEEEKKLKLQENNIVKE